MNDELHARNEELSRVNSDLVNLLGSVQIAIVIVSADLRIRRFTPMAEKVLNLIPADVGRPITQLQPNIDCPDLGELILGRHRQGGDRRARGASTARAAGTPCASGRTRASRTGSTARSLALFDIDAVKRHELEIGRRRAHAEAIVAGGSAHPLVVLDGALRVRTANPAFERAFGVTTGEARGRSILQLDDGRWDVPQLRQGLERLLPEDDGTQEVEADFRVDGAGEVWFYARRLDADDDGEPLILLGLAPRSST